ncbi:hypothetical protein QN277_022653 [Acacia crassicarpa]|uniref:Uncharacterized protein n=1 Tax=Acacia crassicarpa TaxID=499986 RepID=A0AAE1JK48_9FABA|nr:hypothetical protein QN277_022653 [Acacia crassicarpa]
MVETGLRFKRLIAFFTVCFIVVPILITITCLHCNSISYLIVKFPNINNIFSANTQNLTAIISNEPEPAIGIRVKHQTIFTPQPGKQITLSSSN